MKHKSKINRLRIPVLEEADRIKWDLYISFMILIAGFEIPYDWLVGWEDIRIARAFNIAFFISFFLDMILNALTQRVKHRWFLWDMLSFWKKNRKPPSKQVILMTPKETSIGYLKSIWFPIDLLSTIPWAFFAELFSPLNSLRMLRLLRLARLFRVLRLTKALYLLEKIRRTVPSLPSVERLFFLSISIPWFTHLAACMFYFFEKHNPSVTYGNSFYHMWMALIAQNVNQSNISVGSFWLMMFVIGLSVFVFASVTGNFAAIYTGLDLSQKRKNRVMLKGHTVVIGWNNNIFSIISELQVNTEKDENHNEYVVMLTPHSESYVIRAFEENGVIFDPRKVSIFEGSIYSLNNLELLAIERAKNIIIIGVGDVEKSLSISEEEVFQNADIQVLKILLACTQILNQEHLQRRVHQKAEIPIVAAVHSENNATLLRSGIPRKTIVGGKGNIFSLEVVDTEDILSRCIAQATAQPLLVEIFSVLFSYRRDFNILKGYHSVEVYIVEVSEIKDYATRICNKRFDEVLSLFTKSELIGYFTSDRAVIDEAVANDERSNTVLEGNLENKIQHLVLNPGYRSTGDGEVLFMEEEYFHTFTKSDKLVFVARNLEESYFLEDKSIVSSLKDFSNKLSTMSFPKPFTVKPKNVLLLGTSKKATKIAKLLPEYLPEGSTVYCQSISDAEDSKGIHIKPIPKLHHQKEFFDIYNVLSEISDNYTFDTRVVVSDTNHREHHDANILMSLTALHAGTNETKSSTIFEIINQQNEKLANAFHLDNRKVASLLSTEMVSNYLIQLANNPLRGLVYRELLDRSGNEIYFDDFRLYIDAYRQNMDEECKTPSYAEVELLARKLGRVVIGVHQKHYSSVKNHIVSNEISILAPLKELKDEHDNIIFQNNKPLIHDDDFDAAVLPKGYFSTVDSIITIAFGPLNPDSVQRLIQLDDHRKKCENKRRKKTFNAPSI